MSTNQTRPISTRIPMEDYLGFLQEAVAMKITISDYLALKLYGHSPTPVDNEQIEALKRKIAELQEANNALNAFAEETTNELAQAKKEALAASKGNDHVKELKSQLAASKRDITSRDKTKQRMLDEITRLRKAEKDLTAKIKSLEKTSTTASKNANTASVKAKTELLETRQALARETKEVKKYRDLASKMSKAKNDLEKQVNHYKNRLQQANEYLKEKSQGLFADEQPQF